jgi:hypothetical protein
MKQLGALAPELIVLPVYGAQPSEMQSRIFEPAPPGASRSGWVGLLGLLWLVRVCRACMSGGGGMRMAMDGWMDGLMGWMNLSVADVYYSRELTRAHNT